MGSSSPTRRMKDRVSRVHGPDRRVPRRVLLPKKALIAEDTAATPFVALDLGEVEMGDDSPVDDSGFAYGSAIGEEPAGTDGKHGEAQIRKI
jgi:hypothetical protein